MSDLAMTESPLEQTESALRESEERYRFLYTRTPVMLHSSDTNGRLVSVSDYWLRTLGYERSEVIGQPATTILTEASLEHAQQVCFPAFMKTGVIVDEPLQYRKKNGETIDVLLSAIAEKDADGNFVRTLAVSVDVTQRKRAEQAVTRYTKRLETLQEIDRAILAARSPQTIAQAALGRIRELVCCQRVSVAVFNFESGEGSIVAADLHSDSHLHPGSRVPLDTFWKIDTLRQGVVHLIEDVRELPDDPYGRTLRAEGMRSWINIPLIAQDELIGSLNLGSERVDAFSAEDIETVRGVADSLAIAIQQAHLHEQVQRQAAVLEQRVAERTAELEAFSYSVSHDLRTPLRAIDGFSRVLVEDYSDQLDPECRRLLNIICSNAKNMGQLIDDLLAFSRLGRQEIKPAIINMNELAHAAFGELKLIVPERRLQVTIAALPPARGDRAMIHQVFVNLLSNAIKFTQATNPAVIEIGHEIDAGQEVYHVRDNGVGFDMRYAQKLFGVFERLHAADEFEGTGVGLAIVQSIVHRHGGRVWAEAKLNHGATIYFTLSDGGAATC